MKKMLFLVTALGAANLFALGNFDQIKSDFKVFETEENAYLPHARIVFEFEGSEAWLFEPAQPAADGRWIWCMEWPTAFQDRTGLRALLDRGYRWVTVHAASTPYIKEHAGNQNEAMLALRRRFQKYLVEKLGLAQKCGLIGMSWGGFYSVRYASTYPDCVQAIYLDAPLMDFSTLASYRGAEWKELQKFYPFATADYVGKDDPYQSVNRWKPISKAGIRLLILYGGKDGIVPPAENCERFASQFVKAGGNLEMCCRGRFGHHPHGVEPDEVSRIVNFFDGKGWVK